MSVNQVDKQTGDTSRIAGGTLYADAPIGAILAFGGATAPAGWLLCQGQAISRTTYAALFAVIGTAYGAGDGSTTFNLPDPREAALVGAGTNVLNAGSIAAHNAVSLGAFQDDQMQKMEGNIGEVFNFTTPSGVFELGSASPTGFVGDGQYNPYNVQMDTSKAARTGTTTHGKQLGVNYIIKAQQVALPLDIQSEVDKKQNITDNTLQTDSKTVPGAINELKSALSKNTYSTSYTALNQVNHEYTMDNDGIIAVFLTTSGQSVDIKTNDSIPFILKSYSNSIENITQNVKKGQKITVTINTGSVIIRFYPFT